MTLKERIKACYRILVNGKPIGTITYGVRFVKCDECEYNLKCEDCAYPLLMKKEGEQK